MTIKSMLYRVIFLQEDKVYEIYARQLTEETLVGFIEAEELIFTDLENGVLTIPASEQELAREFSGVKRTYIPQHLILRIDEVEKKGPASIKPGSQTSNVSPFPAATRDPAPKKED